MRMGGMIAGMVLVLASSCGTGTTSNSSAPDNGTATTTAADSETDSTLGEGGDDDAVAPEPGVHHLFAGGVHLGAVGPDGWIPLADGRPDPPRDLDIVGVTADVGSPLTVSSNLASGDPCQTVLDLGSGATMLDWELFPRPMATIVASDEHRAAVTEVLEGDGLTSPTVGLREALRVDLDGDGVDEVVLEATVGEEPVYASLPGDYSAVIVRELAADGTVSNTPLALISTTQAEADEAGPDERVAELFAVPKALYSVTDVVDLNGDGVYEIVVSFRGDHSLQLLVFDPVVGFGAPVLESGCSW